MQDSLGELYLAWVFACERACASSGAICYYHIQLQGRLLALNCRAPVIACAGGVAGLHDSYTSIQLVWSPTHVDLVLDTLVLLQVTNVQVWLPEMVGLMGATIS